MPRIKAFFYIFLKSATSISYYRDLLMVGLGFSIKYLLILAILASVFVTAKIAPQTVTTLGGAINDFAVQTLAVFPDDLVITIEGGELSINRTEPFVVKDVLVIDVNGTIEDLQTSTTPVLINKSNILVKNSEGKIEVCPLKDTPNTQITKSTISELVTQAKNYLKFLPYVVFGIILVSTFIYYFGMKLAYLLVVAVLVMFVGKVRGLKLGFSKFYQISLHAMTLPLAIEVVSAVAGTTIGIPMWFFGLNLLIAFAAILKLEQTRG